MIKQFNQEKNAAAAQIKENEEKLISYSITVIDSSSSAADIRGAVNTLNSLLPQLSTDSVRSKAKSYINSGNKKLASMSNIGSGSSNDRGSYKATFTMASTAYTGGGVTAIGLRPVRNPSGMSTVAVDPSVLPLGTKVYIPGYGYAICSDTGSSIKGSIIDLYMSTTADCYSWGKKTVTVYVVAYPGQW